MLDPFCGGGTTVVESLKLRRRVIGVDVNPVATYITEMECKPADIKQVDQAFWRISDTVRQRILSLYVTRCRKCKSETIAEFIEWNENTCSIRKLKYRCSKCGILEKTPDEYDIKLAEKARREFSALASRNQFWFPRTRIPPGDKTNSLLVHNIEYFHELFTKRNLLALSMLLKSIDDLPEGSAKQFMQFAFSASLKWTSRQSHLRGRVIEGWALHAFWIYPNSLEMNVWQVFERRIHALFRGKEYSSAHVGPYCKLTSDFRDLASGRATCMILNTSSTVLPIPDESVDCIVTDPPYGDNVNYAELSDFWYVWASKGRTIRKDDEVVINKTQRKTLTDYETLLTTVFGECYRVLKQGRHLVCTFNSKDARVVASFVSAASRAGFRLEDNGLLFQNPIRAYTTTLHAMQIGAFVGDFIFTFRKSAPSARGVDQSGVELRALKLRLSNVINESMRSGLTEPQLREKAYAQLIPFLSQFSWNESECTAAVDFFESRIRQVEEYFKDKRQLVIAARLREFQGKRREMS
jgi:hypothetical protein